MSPKWYFRPKAVFCARRNSLRSSRRWAFTGWVNRCLAPVGMLLISATALITVPTTGSWMTFDLSFLAVILLSIGRLRWFLSLIYVISSFFIFAAKLQKKIHIPTLFLPRLLYSPSFETLNYHSMIIIFQAILGYHISVGQLCFCLAYTLWSLRNCLFIICCSHRRAKTRWCSGNVGFDKKWNHYLCKSDGMWLFFCIFADS